MTPQTMPVADVVMLLRFVHFQLDHDHEEAILKAHNQIQHGDDSDTGFALGQAAGTLNALQVLEAHMAEHNFPIPPRIANAALT